MASIIWSATGLANRPTVSTIQHPTPATTTAPPRPLAQLLQRTTYDDASRYAKVSPSLPPSLPLTPTPRKPLHPDPPDASIPSTPLHTPQPDALHHCIHPNLMCTVRDTSTSSEANAEQQITLPLPQGHVLSLLTRRVPSSMLLGECLSTKCSRMQCIH